MPAVRALKIGAVLVVALFALFVAPRRVAAQRVDLIHGHVLATDSTPLASAIVAVRDSGATTPPRQARTDDKGAYSVSITDGSGVYIVSAQMLGYALQRRTIHRPAGDSAIAPVNFRLASAPTTLGAVRSVGERKS